MFLSHDEAESDGRVPKYSAEANSFGFSIHPCLLGRKLGLAATTARSMTTGDA